MNNQRYEAVWSTRDPQVIRVHMIGPMTIEASSPWWSTKDSRGNDIHIAVGYGSSRDLAIRACSQNRSTAVNDADLEYAVSTEGM